MCLSIQKEVSKGAESVGREVESAMLSSIVVLVVMVHGVTWVMVYKIRYCGAISSSSQAAPTFRSNSSLSLRRSTKIIPKYSQKLNRSAYLVYNYILWLRPSLLNVKSPSWLTALLNQPLEVKMPQAFVHAKIFVNVINSDGNCPIFPQKRFCPFFLPKDFNRNGFLWIDIIVAIQHLFRLNLIKRSEINICVRKGGTITTYELTFLQFFSPFQIVSKTL